MYIGSIQFLLVLFVFMEAYNDTKFGTWFYEHKLISYPAFLILFLAVSIVVGYLDKKYVRPGELGEISSTNPILMEMKKTIDDLHEKSN